MEGGSATQAPSLAKIQRPRFDQVHKRMRLFQVLDTMEASPMVWISAPAGSGKTTLAASYLEYKKSKPLWYHVDDGDADVASFFYYMGLLAKQAAPRRKKQLPNLTPEFLPGLPIFARNFFREFFQWMHSPGVLVLDNYQAAGTNTALDTIIPILLNEVPQGFRVIVTSRSDPQASLARYRASKQLSLIGWDDMRITEEEAGHIAKAHDRADRLNKHTEVTQQILEDCDGWAAGLILLLEQKSQIAVPDPEAGREVMFDYFLQEILAGADPALVDFLLRTSCLSQITVPIARSLTNNKQADQVLQDLCRRNYFITRHAGTESSYRYHDLFRHFLQEQAEKTFTQEEQQSIRQRAGQLLLERGESDAGVDLLLLAKDWQAAANGILNLAPQMLANGRAQTLAQWFARLPDQLSDENPWITYWMGVCDLGFQPARAKDLFTTAYKKFKEQGDVAGLYHAWAGVMECLWIPMAPAPMRGWLTEFEKLQEVYPDFPNLEIEVRVTGLLVLALFWSSPEHPRFTWWAERAMQLWQAEVDDMLRLDLVNRLYLCFTITGELVKAREIKTVSAGLLARIKSPVATLFGYMVSLYHYGATGEYRKGLQLLDEAIKLQDDTGIYIYAPLILCFGTRLAILAGEPDRAAYLLEQIGELLAPATENVDKAHYYFLKSWHALLAGELILANDYADMAIRLSRHFTANYPLCESLFVKIMVLLAMEQFEQAEVLQNELAQLSQQIHFEWIVYSNQVMRLHMDKLKNGHFNRAVLQTTLDIAHHNDYAVPFACPHKVMASLYQEALENDIECSFISRKIRQTGLTPATPAILAWPFPVKIYTFGRFSIQVHDQAVHMEKKAQKKPVEMLKALIALGGNGIAESHIADMLWPDTEADRAHHSFKANLHRLRRLIGNDSVVLHEGKLSLEPRLVWCDARVFEQDRDEARQALRTGNVASTAEHTLRLLTLYSAPFMPGDDLACIYATRERYRNQLMGLLGDLGHALYAAGNYAESAHIYSAGLGIDPLMESLTQGLLRCHLKLRQPVEALRTYDHCREILQRELGLKPSPDTESLAQAARKISN